jgi:hypothetical protein
MTTHKHRLLREGQLTKSVPVFQGRPPGYFARVSITTPIVPAWKTYHTWGFLEVPAGILNHFWIQARRFQK